MHPALLGGGQVVSASNQQGEVAKQETPAGQEIQFYGGEAMVAAPRVTGVGVAAGPAERPRIMLRPTITIKAVDKNTGQPVPGAAVFYDDTGIGVTGPSATWPVRGELATSDIPQGSHVITVDALGYEIAERSISVPPASESAQEATYTFELGPIELVEEAALLPAEVPYQPPAYEYGYQPPAYGYQPPSYAAPPTYEAPVYEAPQMPAFPAFPTFPELRPPALPPIEYLQQFLLLPFTTIQRAVATTPMARGGRCRR